MKFINSAALIVALAFCFNSSASNAATVLKPRSKACVDMGKVQSVLAQHPEFKNLRPIDKSHLDIAVEIYNSTPPQSKTKWDSAYLIDGPDDTGALIVGMHGKLCNVMVLGQPYWGALVRTVEAAPI